MFFNLFNKHKVKDENNDKNLASISYFIKKDGSGPYINIELEDYDISSADGLSKLLDTLLDESFYLETVNMIKSSLMKDQQEELLIRIFTKIAQKSRNKILNLHHQNVKDELCIKPYDML